MTQTILRLPKVKIRTGLSRSTLYLQVSQGTFPKQVPIGERAVGWPESEVNAIVAARIAGAPDPEIRLLVAKLEAARKAAA
jgi:prophage regulatory protein